MTPKHLVRASKFIALVLRHKPDAAGVSLDAEGWADVARLLAGMKAAGHPLKLAELEEIIAADEKGRYVLSADGRRIRAAQGHSLAADLKHAPAVPPEFLYHGTARRNLESIRAQGLHTAKRQHVHLSNDVPTAIAVGSRHGDPVILSIDASRLHANGQPFFLSENGVWLTGPIAPAFIRWDELQFAERLPRN